MAQIYMLIYSSMQIPIIMILHNKLHDILIETTLAKTLLR